MKGICAALAAGAFAVLGVVGCAMTDPAGTTDPVSAPSGEMVPPDFAWHDLVAPDVASARSFYGDLFGWTFEASEVPGYDWIRHEGEIIGGLVDGAAMDQPPNSAIWLNAVPVGDLEAAVARIKAAGGEIIRSPMAVPGRGRLAVVKDGSGALLQLAEGNPYAGTDADPGMGDWLWAEQISDDPLAVAGFYTRTLGFSMQAASTKRYLLTAAGTPRAAVVENPFEETPPVWIPFVRVASPGEISRKAESMGARIVIEPSADVRGGSLALILDPDGAPLALQQWTPPAAAEGGAS